MANKRPPSQHVVSAVTHQIASQAPVGNSPGGGNPPMMGGMPLLPPEPPPDQPLFPEEVPESRRLLTEESPDAPDGETLSPEEQIMFASLLTCGRRSKTIQVFNHTVVVETLCGDDDLRIGLYVKEYASSLGEQRAYQIGVVAAGIRSIDGQPLVGSLFADATPEALFGDKVKKVAGMYPTVINLIYRAVMDAEKEFVELITRLGKSDG